jgi:alcohol dehydrogenase (cytochrome c)
MRRRYQSWLMFAALCAAAVYPLSAQVTYDRLLKASDEPRNWLTYSGSYRSQRHTQLKQIEPGNVKNLEMKWVFQAASLENFESTPLVVDGIMYFTSPINDVVALDAATGRVFWVYRHIPDKSSKPCCGSVNRGLAIHGDLVYLASLDARLIALDARGGKPVWDVKVGDVNTAYTMTLAPLVVKDKVVIGVSGGEFGIRGFVAAFDLATGKEAWRFYTIPGPGEPGHDSWPADNSWEHGGGPVWLTGSFDPELNLMYWGVGNPSPDWNPFQRPGDNLYTSSVIALDADTGKLRWHYQFTPNDGYDYDSVQIPVLVDANWKGSARKLMMWANRNGFFYVLDRTNGQFLSGTPFVKVNWASGFDDKGRPIQTRQPPGMPTYPGNQGGTNWYSPSYSPRTGLFYVSVWENYASIYAPQDSKYTPGQVFLGGMPRVHGPIPGAPGVPTLRRGPVNNWTEAAGNGAVIAIDPMSGQQKWKFDTVDVIDSGILTTASDLLFVGGREGYFHALDARSGNILWRANLGGQIAAGAMSYQVRDKQYVAIASGHSLYSFALRD